MELRNRQALKKQIKVNYSTYPYVELGFRITRPPKGTTPRKHPVFTKPAGATMLFGGQKFLVEKPIKLQPPLHPNNNSRIRPPNRESSIPTPTLPSPERTNPWSPILMYCATYTKQNPTHHGGWEGLLCPSPMYQEEPQARKPPNSTQQHSNTIPPAKKQPASSLMNYRSKSCGV